MKKGSLLRAATPLMVGRGVSAAITFFIPVVLARALNLDEYGTYKQFFLLAGTVFLVGQLGLTASLYYFVPRAAEGEERRRYLTQTLVLLFTVGAVAAGGTLLFAGEVARRFENPRILEVAAPLAIYLWAYLGAAPLEPSLTSRKLTKWAGFCYVASDLVRTAALILPVKLGVVGVAWGAAAFAMARLVAAWAVVAGSGIAWPTRQTLRGQLGYSLPFAGAVLLVTLQMQLPQYVVAGFTDAATYAVFSVGIMQLPIADMLYTPVAEVMMVRLAQSDASLAPEIFREAVTRLATFFLPLCALLILAAPYLVPLLFGRAYAAAVPIFMIATLEMPLSALPVDGLLRAQGATSSLLRVSALRLALAAALVPGGFFLFGMVGAIAGYVITQWTAKTMLLIAAARRLGVRPVHLLPRPRVLAHV